MRILPLTTVVYILEDMHKQKRHLVKGEPRNLGVTVLTGALTLLFASLSAYILTSSQDLWVYGFVSGALGLMSLGVAVSGRKSLFAIMAELFFWIP